MCGHLTCAPAPAQHAAGFCGQVRPAHGLLKEVVQPGRAEAAGGGYRLEQLSVAAGQQDGLLRVLYNIQPVLHNPVTSASLETPLMLGPAQMGRYTSSVKSRQSCRKLCKRWRAAAVSKA